MKKPAKRKYRALQTAIKEHAKLATEFNALAQHNFYRQDLTRAFPFVDHQPRGTALVRQDEYTWRALAIMEDGTLRTPDYVMGIPILETQEAWDKVSLEQHKLHVRLYEAQKKVQKLAAGVLA
jgi:hypothetical protein